MGKRTKNKGLGDVLGQTETNVVEPVTGEVQVPVTRADVLRSAEPETAPDHAPPAVAPVGF